MDILTLIIVGLVAGLIASFAVGGIGYGLLGDIVVGIGGALLGCWLFRVLHIYNPAHGVGGSILVATIGALGLLLIVRALRRIPRRRLI
jgi:uncharacterized membrane protein YeaQ/YmgE (transglycosylase-associated protein family)